MSWNQVHSKDYKEDNPKVGIRSLHDAQMRNRARWKIRGMGLYLNLPPARNLLTEKEQRIIADINKKFGELRDGWTEGSRELGFNVKPHTCHSCGKHSNKEYLALVGGTYKNYCKKHYNEFS